MNRVCRNHSQNCWRNMQSYILTYSKGESEIALGSQQKQPKFCVNRGPQWNAREGRCHTRDTTVSMLTQTASCSGFHVAIKAANHSGDLPSL